MERPARAIAILLPLLLAGATNACPPDAVVAGPTCVDRYEASIWEISSSETALIAKVKDGTVTLAELQAGATLRGQTSDDYPCSDDGQDCSAIYAASVPGVFPSAFLTWFQAQQACVNTGKRLPTNAEWQMAATGTLDTGGSDDGTTTCNTDNADRVLVETGSRSACVSNRGAYDMVGNVWEWVDGWRARSTGNVGWGTFSDDAMGIVGADTDATGPGAVARGGDWNDTIQAGPYAITAQNEADTTDNNIFGVRCAR